MAEMERLNVLESESNSSTHSIQANALGFGGMCKEIGVGRYAGNKDIKA